MLSIKRPIITKVDSLNEVNLFLDNDQYFENTGNIEKNESGY